MNNDIRQHYLQFSTYTNPGLYKEHLINLPDDIQKIGELVRQSIIHRTTLAAGNTGTNEDLKFGDMTKVPWWRQPEDDILTTAAAMLAELYRRDERGFVEDRSEENKLVVTCRYVSILMAAILKSKGIPARVRAGNQPFSTDPNGVSADHWINQYWSDDENRWITIDVDGSWSLPKGINAYDLPDEQFDFPADAWLSIRTGKENPERFWNAKPRTGQIVVAWGLFYDFHCLMNDEVIYVHAPKISHEGAFQELTEEQLKEIDELAQLMQDPDKNFSELKHLWETKKEFRLLGGGLL